MKKNQYLREIAERACLPKKYRKKVMEDLSAEFDSIYAQCNDEQETMRRMGEPDEVAAGIYENYLATNDTQRPFVEYKSEYELFGMPLIHIVKGRKQTRFNRGRDLISIPAARGFIAIGRRAKGVIVIGNLCCGIIAIGNLSAGVITLANVGLGLFGFGNLILGLAFALGNAVAGLFSIGNGAVGFCAVGNAALGRYAVGHLAAGEVSLSVEAFSHTASLKPFLERLPQNFQPFFEQAVSLMQDLHGYGLAIALLLILGIAAAIIISTKMEQQA